MERKGSRLSACARLATPGGAGYGFVCADESTMGDTLKGPPTTTIPPLQRNVFSTTTH